MSNDLTKDIREKQQNNYERHCISPEKLSSFFDQFLKDHNRIEKNETQETGGTGLGLSIVKHAVAYHGGTIKLDSTVDKGTTITVVF